MNKFKYFYFFIFIILLLVLTSCDVLNSSDEKVSSKTAAVIIYSTPTDSKPSSTADNSYLPIVTNTSTVLPTATPIVTTTVKPNVTPTVKPNESPSESDILSGVKICIDPGHQIKGNYDKEPCAPWNDTLKAKVTSGTSGNFIGTDEYIINLQIAQKLRDKLLSLGADVLMTRDVHEVDISNKERAEISNEFGADITLRIHCNSAESSSAEGIDLFVRGSGDGSEEYKKQSDIDFQIATDMLNYICNETNAKKRYVNRSDVYTGINWCKNTCVIIECGFMSNEKEDRLLNTAEYQDKIAEGIKKYFIASR